MRVLSGVLVSLLLSLPVAAQTASEPMVATTGTGTVEVQPDIATVSIGVTTQANTAAAALRENSAALDAVMGRLVSAGVEKRDMMTSNLYLSANWAGYDSGKPTISGYVASNMLTTTIRSLDQVGAVLDAAVSDGANTLNGVSFGLADPTPARAEARKKAVADARTKAEQLAEASGMKLGKIISITESTNQMPGREYDAPGDTTVPVAGGTLGVTASVTIQYELVE